ncbi:DNA alkylation repair protein [Chromobacterium vaccinii]|uniref:DNA alkylation repair protein n=1 Tax=Chromobacterium vaccinii TaxID=1108595 RepID=UPI000E20BECD|nr:DNA alkylation repair protein [Chromobacterium vaccinii]
MSILGIREELIQRGDAVVAMHSKSSKKSTLQFFGVCVPELRKIAKKNNNLDFDLILRLLNSDYLRKFLLGCIFYNQ